MPSDSWAESLCSVLVALHEPNRSLKVNPSQQKGRKPVFTNIYPGPVTPHVLIADPGPVTPHVLIADLTQHICFSGEKALTKLMEKEPVLTTCPDVSL